MNFWKPLPEPNWAHDLYFSPLLIVVVSVSVGFFFAVFNLTFMDLTMPLAEKIWWLLVIPIVAGGLICTIILLIHNINRFWGNMMRKSYIENRNWWMHHASKTIRLAEHTSLFPVEDAALKMVRLDGEMPPVKDFPRKLNIGIDEDTGFTRTQQVLTRLLEQIAMAALNQPEVWLYIRNADENIQQDASTILKKFLRAPTVHLLTELPQRSMLEEWIMTYFNGCRLLIIMELHANNDETFCEYATALLFTHDRLLPDSHMPVWCFRGLDCKPHQLEQYLNILFAAKQVAPGNLRHVWTGNMQGEGLHLLVDACSETLTDQQASHWHSLSLAETWTPGYQWLMMEWAARAIRHGQRGQLLATQSGGEPQINLAMMCGESVTQRHDDEDYLLSILSGLLKVIVLIFLAGAGAVLLIASAFQWWQDAAIFYLFMSIGGMMCVSVGVIMCGFYISRRHREAIIYYYHQS